VKKCVLSGQEVELVWSGNFLQLIRYSL
jgi:hypothetical protein